MRIVEHLDEQVKVEIVPDHNKGILTVVNSAGDLIVEMQISGAMDLYVPYGSVVRADYNEKNKDILYVPGKTPDEMRKASTRRIPGISVGV